MHHNLIISIYKVKVKVKVQVEQSPVPGPEGARKLRLPDFKTIGK